MSFIATAAIVGGAIAVAAGGAKLGMSLSGRRKRIQEQKEANRELQEQKQAFESLDTSNVYADVENKYANIQTEFENVYEDMTVNQQQAQFEKQMFQQQQADTLQGLRGAAGGSGIAGLAQAMANQGQLQAQRASASIGTQESQLQQLRAGEASRLDQLERRGEQQALMTRLGGEAMVQEKEFGRVSTLLGMQQQATAGAQSGYQQAIANEQAVNMANQQAMNQVIVGGIQSAGSAVSAGIQSPMKKGDSNYAYGTRRAAPASTFENPTIEQAAEIARRNQKLKEEFYKE